MDVDHLCSGYFRLCQFFSERNITIYWQCYTLYKMFTVLYDRTVACAYGQFNQSVVRTSAYITVDLKTFKDQQLFHGGWQK